MPFTMDAGTKSLYETITTILRGDATLKSLINYTTKDPNIRRGYQTEGAWKTLLVFYFQIEYSFTDLGPLWRKIPLIINTWSKENELLLYDIGERVIQLLDGAEEALSKDGYVKVFDCSYEGEAFSLMKDAERQAFNRALRFTITFRKDGE